MKRTRKNDEGAGLIVILVITVVVLLAVVAFHQSNLANSVSLDAGTLVRGDVLQILVQSATEEAMARVEHHINEPSSLLFTRIRQVVYHPDLGKLDLSEFVELPETKAILASPGYEQYQIDEPKVEVVLQRQLDKTEYERLGIVKFSLHGYTAFGYGRPVSRTVEVTRAFKVALTTIPRPYDSYGLYFANVEGVTNVSRVNSLRDGLIEANERLWSAVDRHRANSESDDIKALIGRMLPKEQARERCKELSSFEDGALMGLYYPGVSFRLDTLDLATYLQNLSSGVSRELSQTEAVIGDEPEFIARADKASSLIFEGIWRIWAQSQAFRVIKPSDKAYVSLKHYSFSFSPDFWQRRIQYRVKVRADEKDINEAWSRFRREHPVIKGVVKVENEVPLQLKGAIVGQAVIVLGAGGATLEDLNKNGGPTDVLTIVAHRGTLRIKGECHCSVFLGENSGGNRAAIEIPKSSTLLGSLIAWQAPLATSLQGMLKRDMRYVSGFNGDQGQVVVNNRLLHVALSPKTIYRKVSRK